jgi:hypothetical protein
MMTKDKQTHCSLPKTDTCMSKVHGTEYKDQCKKCKYNANLEMIPIALGLPYDEDEPLEFEVWE